MAYLTRQVNKKFPSQGKVVLATFAFSHVFLPPILSPRILGYSKGLFFVSIYLSLLFSSSQLITSSPQSMSLSLLIEIDNFYSFSFELRSNKQRITSQRDFGVKTTSKCCEWANL
jgi:hypothetical protein